jgi:predicted CXXCH cytochrome family protein
MQPANAATVLGDFNNARLTHRGATTAFTQRDGRYIITTEGPDGRPAEYEVRYTFGVAPLQQYLVAFPGGRLQAPTVAWDAGNKRWFALYPNERHKPDDPLHSTGRYQNWNLMCSECHSTNLARRYDAKTDSYDTKWAELSVGCQACHGPGSVHVAWAGTPGAKEAKGQGAVGLGLAVDFRGTDSRYQVEACSPCHSRRQRLSDGEMPGKPFLDNYHPALLRDGLYYADGQQQDEVYIWGSFLQSRMYARGVRCTDCHDAHSLKLKADGNGVCTQCHQSAGNARFPTLKKADYDSPAHHHHAAGSPGAQCAHCHIPAKNYMVIDARPDHSFRIPRPDISVKIGTPNACNGCHDKKSAQWAADAVAAWYGPGRRQGAHFGEVFAVARALRPEAAGGLDALIADREQPAIVRATALSLLRGYGAAHTRAAVNAKNDPEALVRAAAAGALAVAPAAERVAYVAPLLRDPVRLVRIEAARALVDVPPAQITGEARAAWDRAYAELIASEQTLADMPPTQLNLAGLALRRGDIAAAEAGYRRALAMDPYFEPAYNALASFLSSQRRNADAERALREGIGRVPANGYLQYSLGLLLAEEKRLPEAIAATEQAAKLLPGEARVLYNLGLMHEQRGQLPQAEAALGKARALGDDEAAYALALLYTRQGKRDQALPLAEELARANPGNQDLAKLRDRLRAAGAAK